MKRLVIAAILGSAAAAYAKEHAAHIMLTPAEIQWKAAPPSLPPGAQVSILEGDMAKPGFFALRIKLPAGYKVPPHWHPGHERVTVLSGTFYLGHGDTFDEAALKVYPAGSYSSMPPKMRHFATAKEDTVIQIATIGPWGINYVNPADDPRTKPKP